MARTASNDGFKFWHSYYDALGILPDDATRGHFVMALCAYVFDGVEPEFSDPSERFGFNLIADQAVESKRLSDQAIAKGRRSGKARRRKAEEKAKAEFSTKVFNNGREHGSEHGSERKYVGLSSSKEEERKGAAGAGPWGPAPPRLEDLPPIPGQRDTNGGDRE